MNEPVNEPTPEEAVAALHAVREGRQRVIRSAMGSRWLSISGGLTVFLYCATNDLFPATRFWVNWFLLAWVFVAVVGMYTRVGSSLLGRPVTVSTRSLSITFRWRLLRVAPLLGIIIVVVLIIQVFHVPHGETYYGALAGLYTIFLGPGFQLWLLRRQDKD